MISLRSLGSFLLAGLLGSAALLAKPAATQTLRFLLVTGTELQLPDAPPPPNVQFFVAASGVPKSVTLAPGELTEPIPRPPAEGVEALRETQPAGGGLPAAYTPIARADFPANWNDVLVVVASTPDGQALRLLAVNPMPTPDQPAQLSIYNLTRSPISAKLGAALSTLQPMEQGALPLPGPATEVSMHLFRVACSREAGWQMDISRMLTLDPRVPRLALILPDANQRAKLMLLDPLSVPPPFSKP